MKFGLRESVEWMYLWLAGAFPNGLSALRGRRPGYAPMFKWGAMTAVNGGSLAYLTWRAEEAGGERRKEVGVTGHGPRSASFSRDVAEAIAEWGRRGGNHAPEPGFRMAPAADRSLLKAPDPRFIIDKAGSRVVIDWP